MAKGKEDSGANLGFEGELFKAADKLRGNMEPSDYKHVALGLIFLKYISDAFEAQHAALLAESAQAQPKTRTNTSPTMCFGCRDKRVGRTSRQTPSARKLAP